MTFAEWIKSETHDAAEFRSRLEAGERGNSHNPMLAARIAYEAGIREGRLQAADKMRAFLLEAQSAVGVR